MHRCKARDGNKKLQGNLPFKPNRGKKLSKKYSSNNHQQQGKDSKKKKLTNEDNCPIHGTSHKWGQCHQNQYGESFCPQMSTGPSVTNSSQRTSSRASFHNGLPSQVQVYSNENRSFQSDQNSDNRSHFSNQSSSQYPSPYTHPPYTQECNNDNYQD